MRWLWISITLFLLGLIFIFLRITVLGVPFLDFLTSIMPGWHTTVYPLDIYLMIGGLMVFAVIIVLAGTNSIGRNTNESMRDSFIWWEMRRPVYNFIMLITGLLSLFVSFVSIPLVYLMIGIWLNILYSFGWLIEGGMKKIFGIKGPAFYLFLSYYIFSVIVVVILQLNMGWIIFFEWLIPIGFVLIPSLFFIGMVLFVARKLRIIE